MSESELDLYYSLPILSTYLGHQSLDATEVCSVNCRNVSGPH